MVTTAPHHKAISPDSQTFSLYLKQAMQENYLSLWKTELEMNRRVFQLFCLNLFFFFALLPYLSSSSKIFTVRRPFHQMYRYWGSENKQNQHVQNTIHSMYKWSNISITIMLKRSASVPITIQSISPS